MAALATVVACSSIGTESTAPIKLYVVAFHVPPSIELIPDAQGSIAEAATSAMSGARVIVEIISYMEGPILEKHYIKAAHRRVEVVRRELIARGISADRIAIDTIMTKREEPLPPEPGSIIIFVPKFY